MSGEPIQNGFCRSCGRPIVWARSAKKGVAMPVEVSEGGNLVLDGGLAVYVGQGRGTHVSHHATCPDAARWRRS